MICDQVITEAGTNKKSLIGVFNNVSARHFPCRHPKMCIFVSLTGGHGKARTEVRCVNEDTHETVLGAHGEIAFQNPNHVVEAVFEFNNVVLPSPGLYCIEVLSDDALVLQRRFVVSQIQKKGQS
jgi:hypothetical protein